MMKMVLAMMRYPEKEALLWSHCSDMPSNLSLKISPSLSGHDSAHRPYDRDSSLDRYWPNSACGQYEGINLLKKHLAATLIDKLHRFFPPYPSFVITPRMFDCRRGAEDPRFICHGGHWHPSEIWIWFKQEVSALCISVCEEECPRLLTVCCTRRLMPSWQPYLLRMRTSLKYMHVIIWQVSTRFW